MYVVDVEIWKNLKETDYYQISNLGRVKSKKRILKTFKAKYLQVPLKFNGKKTTRKIHRLIAEAFIPNPLNLPQVNHIDGDKFNNKLENLEWVSASENVVHSYKLGLASNKGEKHPNSKFKDNQIGEILELVSSGTSQTKVAKSLGVCRSTINKIVKGTNYAHLRH